MRGVPVDGMIRRIFDAPGRTAPPRIETAINKRPPDAPAPVALLAPDAISAALGECRRRAFGHSADWMRGPIVWIVTGCHAALHRRSVLSNTIAIAVPGGQARCVII